jgi:tripartite-type tricarboxylate transporter receptor subunit TctC
MNAPLRLLVVAFALLPLAAHSQQYPSKPIRWIVPFPPGGSTDLLARVVGAKLTEEWGQQVVVENRGGAGGTLGAAEASKAAPDGYTLLMGAIHHTIAQTAYPKLSYDFGKDFAPISVVAIVPNVVVVNSQMPVNTARDLIAHAKANPGKLSYASAGMGTAHHLIGELFSQRAEVKILHVPYKGSGPAVTDLVGGQVHMMFDTIPPSLPHIKSGKLRPLAVTTAKRSAALPEVPTLAEAALPGFDVTTWFGALAPAKTPPDIIARLNGAIVKILGLPDVQKRLLEAGAEPVGSSADEMAARIRREIADYGKIVRQANITVQ